MSTPPPLDAIREELQRLRPRVAGLRCPISQRAAVRRLNEADGEAHRVIAKLLAERRRHHDRMNGPCTLRLRRRSDEDLSQRLAECACRSCSGRLTERLGQLIDQAIARRPHTRRDPEEARSYRRDRPPQPKPAF